MLRTRNIANSTKCDCMFTVRVPYVYVIFPITCVWYAYITLEGNIWSHLVNSNFTYWYKTQFFWTANHLMMPISDAEVSYSLGCVCVRKVVLKCSIFSTPNKLFSRTWTCVGTNKVRVSRRRVGVARTTPKYMLNKQETLNTSNWANWRRDETSSYPPFASTSSAVRAVCVVRCFVTPVKYRRVRSGSPAEISVKF